MTDTHSPDSGEGDGTVPDAIAQLQPEDQAMFRRVRAGLFQPDPGRELLDRFELGKMIGAGGMGVVYRAYDPKLDREVAIKLISPRPGRPIEQLRARLEREAQALGRLKHDNVVTVHDVGIDKGQVFVVMDFIEGLNLRERQTREGCTLRERLELYIQAGWGLAAAHAEGVVHRDFKPENVFVDQGERAHVGDFGLAYLEPSEPSEHEHQLPDALSQTGDIHGTMGYSAPEQLRGEPTGPAADQFSFCVALWESVSGVLPFPGLTPQACLGAIQDEPRGAAWVPRRLRRILLVGLAHRSEDRHASMDALVSALQAELQRPRRLIFGGVGVALLSLALGASGYASYLHMHKDDAEPCPTADRLVQLRAADWSGLAKGIAPQTAAVIRARVDRLEADARDACIRDDASGQQRVEGLTHYLELALARVPTATHDQLANFVMEFNSAFAPRPSRAMSPSVSEFVWGEIQALAFDWKLEPLVARLDCALDSRCGERSAAPPRPLSAVDRAELLLRRARAHAYLGEGERALRDYRAARRLAVASDDEERQLQATIGLAKTSIMREDRFESGAELLNIAADQLAAQRWPALFDMRRAQLFELDAALARRRGAFDDALWLQSRALLRYMAFGSRYEQVAALVNLGNIYADKGELGLAKYCYESALELDPDEPEVALNLGMLLVQSSEDGSARGRALLEGVAEKDNHELQAGALLLLLEDDITQDHPQLAAHRSALERRLNGPRVSPTQAMNGWMLVAYGYAATDDFVPALEEALAKAAMTDPSQAEYVAGLTLDIAEIAVEAGAEPAARLVERAHQGVASLEPTAEHESWAEVVRELQAALEAKN